MFEVRVTVSCPDLVAAAKLLRGIEIDESALAKCVDRHAAPQAAPVQRTAAPVAQQPQPATGVPLAQAPTFTQADIAKAGAELFTTRPDLQPQVMALLGQYGCQSVMDLKPEQFGAFATALRGLGAKI